jgi:hypothetical protein
MNQKLAAQNSIDNNLRSQPDRKPHLLARFAKRRGLIARNAEVFKF